MKRRLFTLMSMLLFFCVCAMAQQQEEICKSVSINFRQSKTYLDLNYKKNRAALEEAEKLIAAYQHPDSAYTLAEVKVVGGASPEGSVKFNEYLSRTRADRIFNHLGSKIDYPDSLVSFDFLGRDWKGLRDLVEQDKRVPYRDDVLKLLDQIIENTRDGESESAGNLLKLKRLHGCEPYIYMYHRLFPALRASKLQLKFVRKTDFIEPQPEPEPTDSVAVEEQPAAPAASDCIPDTVVVHDTIYVERPVYVPKPCKPFYMDIHTNMLCDALAVPNIGVEFYLGKNISISADWMYGWWRNDARHRYWRIYGGEMALRWWFGKAAHTKPLTGHHLGLYGGALTYDFEWGGRGYMGGLPGGSLWDRCNYVGGLEYGYSQPIARRLNIDFTVGIGYMGGEYREYIPIDGCYVWQTTKRRNWFGPTKAQISLVWLLGCRNTNDRLKMKRRKGE